MKKIELVGFDDFDKNILEQIEFKMKPFLNKYTKIFENENIQDFKLVLETFKKDGGKDLHELTMTLNTTDGDYRVKKNGWYLLSLIDQIESVLERQVKERKERRLKVKEGRNA